MIADIDNGLSVITVDKAKLLASLRSNAEKHRADFVEAETGYKEKFVERLKAMLAKATSGVDYVSNVGLVAPRDHSKEYTRVIGMLDMSIKDTVQITESEFSNYVLDEWAWKEQFVGSTQMYKSSNG